MIYILDTTFFVDVHRLHMPVESCNEFWDKMLELAHGNIISTPNWVYKELMGFNDALADWIVRYRKDLVDQENTSLFKLAEVMEKGYGDTDVNLLEKLKADPYVIAHALAVGGSVVTSEKFADKTKPANKKIPQVCAILNIPCFTATRFLWEIRDDLHS